MGDRLRAAATLTLLLGLALALCVCRAAPATAAGIPHIDHLFIIVLENEDADESFGADPPAPYLGKTLKEAGAFMPNYFGTGHNSLDNYLSMISGQPPNTSTQADCPVFSEMLPGTPNAAGVAVGQGCVYPSAVQTVANQLESEGQTWRGYMQDMANSVAAGAPATCRHPAIGGIDETEVARPGDQYATKHDPFVYFHSIIDSPACQKNVVDLRRLPGDLRKEATTPEYVFITPDLCADGHDATCADGTSPGGFAGIEAFLHEWVPRIQASPAYRSRGALLVTFDESETGGESCCNETSGPNTVSNGGSRGGNGGGKIGAVMLSPCVRPGTVTQAAYNHYSMLRWVEDNFEHEHLAEAAKPSVKPFGSDVFSRPDCLLRMTLTAQPSRATAGKKTAYRFQLKTQRPECLAGARVHFGDRHARTNKQGIALITKTIGTPGVHYAAVSSPLCNATRTPIRIVAR